MCEACKTRQVQCLVGGEPIAGKLKASMPKAKDDAKQGDRSPKKKKHKVVSTETIKESEEEYEAEAEAANK